MAMTAIADLPGTSRSVKYRPIWRQRYCSIEGHRFFNHRGTRQVLKLPSELRGSERPAVTQRSSYC